MNGCGSLLLDHEILPLYELQRNDYMSFLKNYRGSFHVHGCQLDDDDGGGDRGHVGEHAQDDRYSWLSH